MNTAIPGYSILLSSLSIPSVRFLQPSLDPLVSIRNSRRSLIFCENLHTHVPFGPIPGFCDKGILNGGEPFVWSSRRLFSAVRIDTYCGVHYS